MGKGGGKYEEMGKGEGKHEGRDKRKGKIKEGIRGRER